jgi:psp operon transcriptional activator
VRIIGATNVDLTELATQGSFKRDLLDRLSFEVLFVPPLRERESDIMLLARHFAARMAYELGRDEVPEFSDQAVKALEGYLWPGNVRELKNVVERAVYKADSDVVEAIIFDPFQSPFKRVAPAEQVERTVPSALPEEGSLPVGGESFAEAIRNTEIRLLSDALRQAHHNQKKAAEILGLTYHQFRGLYRKHKKEINSRQ